LDKIAGLYKGHYLIVVARFRENANAAETKLSAYVKLGKRKNTKEVDFFMDMIAELEGRPVAEDRTFKNVVGKVVTVVPDEKTDRSSFRISANTWVAEPAILLKFASGDFAHMIPDDATAATADKILYGPTNYAVYIDVEDVRGGGYGILLNGSRVDTLNGVHRSGGYLCLPLMSPGGFLFRYNGYSGQNYTEVAGATNGARSMYFYDAAKKNFPAPVGTDSENFNENAGAASGASLYYRLPFLARNRNYIDQITGSQFSVGMEGRDDRYIDDSYNYGMVYIPMGLHTPYSAKHMQSWHMYSETNSKDINGGNDNRIGFRWDSSWNSYQQGAKRHILKLTILEVTRNIGAGEIEPEWQDNIHHTGGSGTAGTVHKAGDLFVRIELIQLKNGATDWNNSRNYVYSKPIWFGKFKGDAWRGDGPSPFKKLGNTMQHIVADPEPRWGGDSQSFRRRGMRVRSWKEAFLGWNFTKLSMDIDGRYSYTWEQFANPLPPDFVETADSVWTPPIAIDMNDVANNLGDNFTNFTQVSPDLIRVLQSGEAPNENVTGNTFGQYRYTNSTEYVEMEKRDGDTDYSYNGKYSSKIYGRLSILRPWGNATPIFGLYAMRGWDFGTNAMSNAVYDSPGEPSKRFLTVAQGLQLPYKPSGLLDREPGHSTYAADRDRIFGFRFWLANPVILYDTWIGEGFSPREVRAILGLTTNDETTIRGTYVYSDKGDTLGQSDLEKAGYYMPIEE
jgi:hypothetical protein